MKSGACRDGGSGVYGQSALTFFVQSVGDVECARSMVSESLKWRRNRWILFRTSHKGCR